MFAKSAASSVSAPIDAALGQMLRGDPLARWLARWRIAPLGFGLIVLAYGLVHALLLPFFFGHLRTATGVVGTLDDWPYLVIMVVVVPLLAAYYVGQPRAIQNVYTGIAERVGHNAEAAALAADLVRPLGWSGWAWAAVAVSTVQVASFVNDLSRMTTVIWLNVNPAMIASAQPLRFLAFYRLHSRTAGHHADQPQPLLCRLHRGNCPPASRPGRRPARAGRLR